MIKKDNVNYRAFEGDCHPVNVFVGENKVAGYVSETAEGQELELSNTYNDSYEDLKVFGKSEQKAKWYQAEGVTTQIQETGYNLLDCEAEWLPVGNDGEKGITNIVTGKGSVSFDFDGNGVPYLENQKAIHLKAGSYYVSGLNSESLDSVGFSGISEPLWNRCNGVITVPEEGDYKFYIYPMSYAHSMTISNLMIVEGDTSKTYQEYGYSKPSPAYPSELTSHISAGSYQIPTENGIYEVTLTEDLRGLDDTYRDKICFDSISGTGYLNKMCKEIVLDSTGYYGIHAAFDRGDYIAFYTALIPDDMIKDASTVNLVSDRYKAANAYDGNGYTGNVIYQYGEASFNSIVLKTDKKLLSSPDAAGFKAWLTENPVTVIYKRKTPVKEALTFTKVSSSTLPVLPCTAYGENLVDEYAYNFEFTGTKNKEIIIPVNAKTTGEYTISCTVTDKSDITYSSSGSLVSLEFKYSDDTDSYGSLASVADWVGDVTESTSNPYKKLKQIRIWKHNRFTGGTIKLSNIMLNIGQLKAYEPFNPTPPESITPSSDYPQQIYDLKDVTVTSQGKNLATAQQVYSGATAYLETTLDGRDCVRFIDNVSHRYTGITFKENAQYTVSFEAKCVQQASVSGESLIFRFFYTDGTNSSITASSNTAWKEYVLTSTAGKTVSYIGLSSYNYVNYNYIDVNTFQLEEGTERTPFDKYRCTSATIPIESCCMEIDETLYDLLSGIYGKYTKDGKYYVCDYIAIRNDVVTYVKCINDETLSASTPFIQDGDNRFFRTSSSFSETLNQPYKVLCQSTHLPGITHGNAYANLELGVSKVTHTISISKKGIFANMTVDDFNGWLGEQYDVGMPVIVRSILNIPVETEITDTWAQDLLALKTAPYYTKLFADKEAGGISATYKHF